MLIWIISENLIFSSLKALYTNTITQIILNYIEWIELNFLYQTCLTNIDEHIKNRQEMATDLETLQAYEELKYCIMLMLKKPQIA